jgi:sarcosine oxidase, subunit beta
MPNAERFDVAIIGGGVVGCATAFFAARAGLRCVLLERRPALATLTTAASTGAFRLQFDNPEEIALVREGIDWFDRFAERTGLDDWDLGLRHGGYLFCSLTDAAYDRARRLVERQRGWGLDVDLLSGDEARRRWRWLSPEVRGARFRAGDGWLDAKRLAIGYATAAADAARIPDATPGGGAGLAPDTSVTGILTTRDGSAVTGVRTSDGTLTAEAVVVAAGPFSRAVAKTAGLEIELHPTIRQKMVIPELPVIPPDAPMTIDEGTAAHWRPALSGAFGLHTDARTAPGEAVDPVPIDHGWAFGLLDPASGNALARIAPFWRELWNDGAPAFSWFLQSGQYEMTPDRRPYLGPAGPSGLFLNTGYSGHGIMAGTAGSRLVADAIAGRPDPAMASFRADRVPAPREHDIL